jgi:hypothetical protein
MAGLVAGGAPALATSAGPVASAAASQVNPSWGKAAPVPGAAGSFVVTADSCAPGAECTAVGVDNVFGKVFGGFVITERAGAVGTVARIPGIPAADSVAIAADSCAASGDCLAGGAFGTTTGAAFVSQQLHGVWGKPVQIPGMRALATQGSVVNFVSCPAVADCAAEGSYFTGTVKAPVSHEFVASESRGTWGNATPVPGLDALAARVGNPAVVTALSCASPGNCALAGASGVAVGIAAAGGPGVASAARSGSAFSRELAARQAARRQLAAGVGRPPAGSPAEPASPAFVASEVHGTWSAVSVPAVPGISAAAEVASIGSVACPAPGQCVAGGSAASAGVNANPVPVAFTVTQSGATWSAARLVPGLADLTALACPTTGTCLAGGDDARSVAATAAQAGAGWQQAAELPGATSLSVAGHKAEGSEIDALACGSALNCSVGGAFGHAAPKNQTAVDAFVASQVNGKWSPALAPAGSAALNTGGTAAVSAMACASAATCMGAGLYTTSSAAASLKSLVVPEIPAVATVTSIGLSAGRITFGREQAERISVKVASHSGAPGGSVSVKSGSRVICVISLKSGAGSCTLASRHLPAGKYFAAAFYSGSFGFGASRTAAKVLTVVK